MSEENYKDVRLGDPLSEVTRRERRMLLAVSMIGITLVKMQLVPTRISALGIEFEKTDQQSLLIILAFIVIYFVVAFILYAGADFLAWRKVIRQDVIDALMGPPEKGRINPVPFRETVPYREPRDDYIKIAGRGYYLYKLTGPISFLRATFEFILPVIVGIFSIFFYLQTKSQAHNHYKQKDCQTLRVRQPL
jgi:hypothetical protein